MPTKPDAVILETLQACVSPIIGRSVLACAMKRAGTSDMQLRRIGLTSLLVTEIEKGLLGYGVDAHASRECIEKLHQLAGDPQTPSQVAEPSAVEIREEGDIVKARVKIRETAKSAGFTHTDQVKIATAVSELARNMCQYAGEGRIAAEVVPGPPAKLRIVAEDRGPGIHNLDEILSGSYQSKTGMGLGLRGCKRLMDEFSVSSGDLGTTVIMSKHL